MSTRKSATPGSRSSDVGGIDRSCDGLSSEQELLLSMAARDSVRLTADVSFETALAVLQLYRAGYLEPSGGTECPSPSCWRITQRGRSLARRSLARREPPASTDMSDRLQ